jgi:hypothetical protein
MPALKSNRAAAETTGFRKTNIKRHLSNGTKEKSVLLPKFKIANAGCRRCTRGSGMCTFTLLLSSFVHNKLLQRAASNN